jgi:hypothetical protein
MSFGGLFENYLPPGMRLGCLDFIEKGPMFLRSCPIDCIIFEYDFATLYFSFWSLITSITVIGNYYSGVGETIAVLGRVEVLSLEAAFFRPSSRMT